MIGVTFLSDAVAEVVNAPSTTWTGGSCPTAVGLEGHDSGISFSHHWARATAIVLCDVATVMDRLAAPVYLLLTLIAIVSLASPFCRSLSLHGKMSVDGGCSSRSGSHNSGREGGEDRRPRKSCCTEELSSTDNRNSRDDAGSTTLGCGSKSTPRAYVSAIADAILHGRVMRVRKRRFGHFYVVGVVGSTFALLFRLSSIMSRRTAHGTLACASNRGVLIGAVMPLVLLLSHCCRRLYECHRVHVWRDDDGGVGGTMHLAGYVVGMVHYLFLPLVFLDFGPKDDVVASARAFSGGEDSDVIMGDDDDLDEAVFPGQLLWICAGTALCLWSQAVQHRHHVILADLRRRPDPPDPPISAGDVKNGESSSRTERSPSAYSSPSPRKNVIGERDDAEGSSCYYRLPMGGWFEYTSSPHYLAEIIIYVSFVVTLHCCSGGGRYGTSTTTTTAVSSWFGSSSSSPPSFCPSEGSSSSLSSSSSMRFDLTHGLRRVLGEGTTWEVLLDRLSEYKSTSLLLWVVTNLSISASRSHAYYLRRFGGGRQSSENGDGGGGLERRRLRFGQIDAEAQVERRAVLIPFIW